MRVSFEKINEIVTGVSYVEKHDKYIQFHRFSKEEEDYYANAEYLRHYSTSGVRLEFITDSTALKVKVHVTEATPAFYFSHDVLLNGKKIGDITNFDMLDCKVRKPVGEFQLGDFEGSFVLGNGSKRVSILFPWSVNSMLEELEIDDGSTIQAVQKPKKLLAYGDSISYGASAAYPSDRYLSRLADSLDAEELCKGIGGEVFCPGLVACAEHPDVDCVTVAYGTNDVYNDFEDAKARCVAFFENLSRAYTDVPVYVISPLWRTDCDEGDGYVRLKRIETLLSETSAQYANFVFINGYDLIPHNIGCYADFVHPNDMGLEHYSANLAAIIGL